MLKTKKRSIILLFIFALVLALSITASADMGPKDRLTVYVKNAPTEPYYLDLLTQYTRPYDNFPNDSGSSRESFNPEMLALLYSFESDGWFPALTEGTGFPMWGNLVGTPDSDRMIHKFGYVGVPGTYRIIIVTESGVVAVSETHTRAALQSSVTFDYASKESHIPPVLYSYVLQFFITFTLTLLLEGIVLVLFGISLKKNWLTFLLVNLTTQIILTLTVGLTLIKSGTFSAHLIQVPAELIITAAEAVAYRFLLKGIGNKRKIAYGITANLVSWLTGFFLLNYMFLLLNRLL